MHHKQKKTRKRLNFALMFHLSSKMLNFLVKDRTTHIQTNHTIPSNHFGINRLKKIFPFKYYVPYLIEYKNI